MIAALDPGADRDEGRRAPGWSLGGPAGLARWPPGEP